MPIHQNVTLDSQYEPGDLFDATVVMTTPAGIVVADQNRVTAFLATGHLRLTGTITELGSCVRVGETLGVRVLELRPGHSRAGLMVELADENKRAELQERLDGPAGKP
jgi:ribosomal protein S1